MFVDLIKNQDKYRQLTYRCPGCKDLHVVALTGIEAIAWNGNYEKPSFFPSILIYSGHHLQDSNRLYFFRKHCWCNYNKKLIEQGKEPCCSTCYVCHSIISDGLISFLSDCTHELAGKTVPFTSFENI